MIIVGISFMMFPLDSIAFSKYVRYVSNTGKFFLFTDYMDLHMRCMDSNRNLPSIKRMYGLVSIFDLSEKE